MYNNLEIIIKDESIYNNVKKYINVLSSRNLPIIFNLRHLRKILQIHKKEQALYFGDNKKELYNTFLIKKKSGGYRVIDAPCNDLKIKQNWIKKEILDKIYVSNHANGFIKNKSIVDNARIHINKKLIINIDIKDFFPSITYRMVFRLFKYIGYNKQVSHLLTKLCVNKNNVLPQGAPTSPIISNIVLLKLDKRLSCLASKFSFDYSRYADDLTFSGDLYIKSFVTCIVNIIKEEGFSINEKKLRYLYSNRRQEVTGIIVNKKLNISKKIISELNNAIYYIKKYGIYNHLDKINCHKSFYKEHLFGLAYFCHMIDKKKGCKYLKLLNELNWNGENNNEFFI